jgi:predicted RNA-binding protein Jag
VTAAPATTEKRKPGRPPKAAAATAPAAPAATEKRKPGRPPKAAAATAPAAPATTEKRKPGRPPKAAAATATAATEKRKPGRPPKAAAATPASLVAATAAPVDEAASAERSWRVWEIATALGYNSKEMAPLFASWGVSIDASSHMKFVTLAQVEALNARLAALKLNKRVNTGEEASQRLYEVAGDFNMSVPDLRKRIEDLKLGWDVSTHMKRLTTTQVAALRQKLGATALASTATTATEPTVRLHELAARAGVKWPAFRAAAEAAGAKGDFGSHLRQIPASEGEALLKLVKSAPAPAAELAAAAPAEAKPALRRVHEAAATLGMKSPEFIARAKAAGVALGSHLAFVTPDQEAAIAAALSGAPVIAPAETAVSAPSEKRKPGRPAKAAPVAEAPVAAVVAPAVVEKAVTPAPVKAAPVAAPAPNPAFAAGSEYLGSVLPDLGVSRPKIAVSQSGDYVEFEISGFDAARLLGSANAAARTEVVESLEQMTGKAIQNATGQTLLVRIDISGFRKNRRSEISEAAQRLAKLVVDSNLPVAFGVIGSFDRFAFHNALKQDGVFTESEGQGAQRRLTVSPRRRKDA